MESYLSAFKYGMPPHGGLGIGLERLTMQLIGEDNVREATLFPRDLSRLDHRSQLLGLWRVRMQAVWWHVCIYFAQKFKLVPTFPADRLLAGCVL